MTAYHEQLAKKYRLMALEELSGPTELEVGNMVYVDLPWHGKEPWSEKAQITEIQNGIVKLEVRQ